MDFGENALEGLAFQLNIGIRLVGDPQSPKGLSKMKCQKYTATAETTMVELVHTFTDQTLLLVRTSAMPC